MRFLFMGNMAQAAYWARTNGHKVTEVIPATAGAEPWLGVAYPPTIIDTGAKMGLAGQRKAREALQQVIIIAATARRSDALDDLIIMNIERNARLVLDSLSARA